MNWLFYNALVCGLIIVLLVLILGCGGPEEEGDSRYVCGVSLKGQYECVIPQ